MHQPITSKSLSCQELISYNSGKKELIIPASFDVAQEALSSNDIKQCSDLVPGTGHSEKFTMKCQKSTTLDLAPFPRNNKEICHFIVPLKGI